MDAIKLTFEGKSYELTYTRGDCQADGEHRI